VSTRQSCRPYLEVFQVFSRARLSAPRYSRLGAPNLWALTSRASEFTRSLGSLTRVLNYGRLRSSRGFATRDLEHPTLGSYLASLRAHEIPGSLPPVLLGWTAQILSWLRHSRLGASNFWTPTSRTSELTRSLDLCHLSSSDGRLRSSRGLRHSRLGASNFWTSTPRTSELTRSLDLCHLSSSDGRLRSSRGLATRDLEHPTFGLLPREPPSSRDPWISATCPPRMDGSDPLVASPLATWSIQLLDFYPASLRAHEIPGSLPPVLLGWTAQILSWPRHSRLGASNFWTSTPRASEVIRGLNPRLSPYRSNDCRVS
jgi:hypothetical protein